MTKEIFFQLNFQLQSVLRTDGQSLKINDQIKFSTVPYVRKQT